MPQFPAEMFGESRHVSLTSRNGNYYQDDLLLYWRPHFKGQTGSKSKKPLASWRGEEGGEGRRNAIQLLELSNNLR